MRLNHTQLKNTCLLYRVSGKKVSLKAILFFQKPCIIDMYFVVIPLNKLMGNHSQVDFYDFKSVVFLILVTI